MTQHHKRSLLGEPRLSTCQASCSRRCLTSGDRCRAAAPPSATTKGLGDDGGDAAEDVAPLPPCFGAQRTNKYTIHFEFQPCELALESRGRLGTEMLSFVSQEKCRMTSMVVSLHREWHTRALSGKRDVSCWNI